MQQRKNDELEMDIKELILVLLRKAWIMILAGVICALGTGFVSYFAMDPIYTSSTKIYVINRQNSDYISYSDLQTSTQLTMDYKILVLSRPVTEQVIQNLKLNMTHSELVSSITVTAPEDTRILQIEVENKDPALAKQLADAIAEVSARQMVSVMEMEKVNIVEPGNLPKEPSGPKIVRNTMLGGVVGGFVAALIILLIYFMNDTIKTPEDIEKYLGITTLGTLPMEAKRKFSGKRFRTKKVRNDTESESNSSSKKDSFRIVDNDDTSINESDNADLEMSIMFDKKEEQTRDLNEFKEDAEIDLRKDPHKEEKVNTNITYSITEGVEIERSKEDFASNEAYKTLRTNILFCGKEVKTICITSCLPNEGKTMVSFQLAKTIAQSGKKVLFIDADLRKSVIISRFKIEKASYGLSQYLSGMNELNDVINKTNMENVDIIFTGPIPPNPSEMLGSETFKELLKSQRENYDYIIIDTPPLGIVIDSANVAESCDGTIMVIEANNISYKLAQKVLNQLEKSKCRVLGAVLNKVEVSRKGYYGKSYGKYYGKYYGEF